MFFQSRRCLQLQLCYLLAGILIPCQVLYRNKNFQALRTWFVYNNFFYEETSNLILWSFDSSNDSEVFECCHWKAFLENLPPRPNFFCSSVIWYVTVFSKTIPNDRYAINHVRKRRSFCYELSMKTVGTGDYEDKSLLSSHQTKQTNT